MRRIQEPVNLVEKRPALRSLMNVRWPMEASDKFYEIQDALLKEELDGKRNRRCRQSSDRGRAVSGGGASKS